MKGGSHEDEYWPLSGKAPYFDIIVSKSHLRPRYNLYLPVKVHRVLPALVMPAVFTNRGNKWDVTYNGNSRTFDYRWRRFAEDNNLKVGDACVFELTECKPTRLEFKVLILRGDLPKEFMHRISGETADNPILIE